MSNLDLSYIVFAQISRWERLGDGLHRGRGRLDFEDMLPWIVAAAIVAIVTFIALKIRKRNDLTQPCNDPEKLFRELSLEHKLDGGSRRLLRQLAEAFQLNQPAEIFLQPELLQPERIPQDFRADTASIEALRKQLFN